MFMDMWQWWRHRSTVLNPVILIGNILLLFAQLYYFGTDDRPTEVVVREIIRCPPTTSATTTTFTTTPCPTLPSSTSTIGTTPKLAKQIAKWNMNWDRRADMVDKRTRRKPKATRRLFMVRHGQYYREGPQMPHLTSLGRKQAAAVGMRLRQMNITFHRFLASTAIRAKETAEIVHRHISYLNIEWSDLLREGKPMYPEPPIEWWDPKHEVFQIEGRRIEKAFQTYFHRSDPTQENDSNEIMVAHGNVIGYFTLRAIQLPPERWLKVAVFQGTISIIELYPDGHVTVRALGDGGHIPFREWSD